MTAPAPLPPPSGPPLPPPIPAVDEPDVELSRPATVSTNGRSATAEAGSNRSEPPTGWLPVEGGRKPTPTVVEREEAIKRSRRTWKSVIEWVAVIVGALVVAMLLRAFLIAAFWIPSSSMNETLRKDDRVLVNKLSYRLHDVHRGDVVVFERPANEPDPNVPDLIKRVVGLPGDRLEIREGKVWINGTALNEPYVHLAAGCTGTTPLSAQYTNVTVPAGNVYVMGDNRCNSRDSRAFGPIDTDLIVGRAFVRIWPLNRLGWL